MPSPKINLMNLSPGGLRQLMADLGERPYRAQQLLRWIYRRGASDFEVMTDLRRSLRERLGELAVIEAPPLVDEQCAADGTRKWVLDIGGGELIETVCIPEEGRTTLCVSTQAGCPLGCTFCHTGAQGFSRNLTLAEIIGQVYRAATRLGFREDRDVRPISNVVMMGMGEPLLNLRAVLGAVELLLSDHAFGLSKRRVTISTAGLSPVLNRMAGRVDVALALSLHAPNDELRSRLMPVNARYDIASVLAAVRNYISRSNANCGRVVIEYVLLDRVNDHVHLARELAQLLRDLPCKINLIPFNPHEGACYARPSAQRIDRFRQVLLDRGFTVTVRTTRGDDIRAACGQLAGLVRRPAPIPALQV